MATPEELAEWATRDDATLRLLREATSLDHVGWVVCPGHVDGRPCAMKLAMCLRCRTVGCYAFQRDPAGCPNTLLDHTKTCVHCGESAGMNRNVKLTHYVLGRVWSTLHATS